MSESQAPVLTDEPGEPLTAPVANPPGENGVVEKPPALGRRVFRPQTLLSFLIAFAALYFLYKQSSSLDLHTIWNRIRAAQGGILLLAFGVYYTTFIVRSLRWQTLLANVGYSRAAGVPVPSVVGLGEILYISWFANCVTPARLGDAYRGYLLKRSAKVSFTVTMGTILAERLIDITVLAAMMAASALAAFKGKLPPEAERALAGGIILAGVGLIGLVFLRRLRPLVAWVLPDRFLDHYIGFENGVVGSFKRVPLLVGYSLIGWLIEGLTLYLTAQSLGAHLTLVGAIVVALVASLLTTVPFTPAGLGVTEAGMVLVLTRLGLDVNTAGAVALLNRVINYWSIIVFGFILYLFSRKK
ncbi:MAG: lysylphosphatidylglycerol synthase transmembrane domain-containing protein [Thermomicrobiales bacterium]